MSEPIDGGQVTKYLEAQEQTGGRRAVVLAGGKAVGVIEADGSGVFLIETHGVIGAPD